jgi:CheY-like chemotaxis protein
MGGEISLDSTPGKGTTLTFRARFDERPGPAKPWAVAGMRTGVLMPNCLRRKSLIAQLESLGCSVEVLTPDADGSGSDVVFSESAVPLIEPGVPVVLVTTQGQHATAECQTANELLFQPVRQRKLAECLARIQQSVRWNEDLSANLSQLDDSVRILVAEDNPVNQKVARHLLVRIGYTADIVSNGEQAVAAVERGEYGLVLMDCLMPEMDGFEATRRIRRLPGRRGRIPIIAMTAGATTDDQERCMAAGMDAYLAKPVEAARLRSAIERWLSVPAATGDRAARS